MRDTYDPSLYDLFHPHDAGDTDVAHYLELARDSEGPVLELGAGTGRTLIPLAREGLSCVGVDSSPRMLEALRARLEEESKDVRERVEIVEGDMSEFHSRNRFGLVQIPFRGFLHNVTKDSQRDCARACYEHLRPGGTFTFSVFHPSLEFMRENSGSLEGVWRWRRQLDLADGSWITLSDCQTYDTVNQRVSSRLRYDHWGADGALQRSHLHCLELAYLYPGDIEHLLSDAGFEDIDIRGGFDGAPFDHDGQELIVQARRPQSS